MPLLPDPQRLYAADVTEEFGGMEVSFTHYIRFFPDGTLRCCLKQDFTFPSSRYRDPEYMQMLFTSPDSELLCREEVLSGVFIPTESGLFFTVFDGTKTAEEGTGTILPNGLLLLRVHNPECPGVTTREYDLC